MHPLRCVSTNVCGRIKLEIKQVRWCTQNTLEISFKHVTNTLLYVGIRCHTANRYQNFVLA